ncbi:MULTISPECIES: MFS transporter [unclassified Kitasatospora]|uniref:MFS transporter n=1 Tax=unclassified Kitasatospora TaxID=2633591 RepID=UPI00070E61F9|nr:MULTISPECIES: MFS transporter [unclassified Kitasatospora]KQV13374.1 MFS transporter [Kitasatospora sp. Root107]KRB75178.1 MFS transporter [Kitasatospora sp. Root187]
MTTAREPSATSAPANSSDAPSVHGDDKWSPRLWGTLIVLCAALFLDALDVSMVGVALPSIGDDLHLSTSTLQWVVSGYVLGYGGLLLLGGRAADLLGRREVFLIALAVFAAASLLGGLVDNGGLLIAARFVKGVAAAFTAPAGLSIITTTFAEGPARNRALSIYTVTGASGFSLGLVLSGLLTSVGWRFTFLMPVPVALIALVFAFRLLPRQPRPERGTGGYDIAGAITGTGSLLLLVFTVTEAQSAGWASARTILSLLVVVALAAAFLVIEQRTAHPLVRLGIFRNGGVARANLTALALFGSYAGFQFVATLYLQRLLGWSALEMALAFLPAGALVALSATKMGAIVDRFGTGRLMLGGVLSLTLGYVLFLRLDEHSSFVGLVLPSMVLLGIGFALGFPSVNIAATNGVSDDEQGLASGLVNTAFQVGSALVLAAATAVITAGSNGGQSPAAQLDGYRPALLVISGISLLGFLVTAVGVVLERNRKQPVAVPDYDYSGAATTSNSEVLSQR